MFAYNTKRIVLTISLLSSMFHTTFSGSIKSKIQRSTNAQQNAPESKISFDSTNYDLSNPEDCKEANPTIYGFLLNLPKDWTCFKVYKSSNCNKNKTSETFFLQFFNTPGSKQTAMNLPLNSDSKNLLNYNMHPGSFALCSEKDGLTISDKFCIDNRTISLSLKSTNQNEVQVGIKPNNCTNLIFVNEPEQIKIILANEVPICLDTFSEYNCVGKRVRFILPVSSIFWSQNQDSWVVWQENGGFEKFMDMRSVYKCSYCNYESENNTWSRQESGEKIKESVEWSWRPLIVSGVASLTVLVLLIVVILGCLFWRRKRKIRSLRKRCIPTIRVNPQQHNMYQSDDLLNSQVNDVACLKMLCASFSDGYEIPRNLINIGNRDSTANMIGVGEFSIILKGYLEPEGTMVAVKTMKPGQANPKTIKWTLRECQVFKQLGKHPRILEFFGVCTENVRNGELFVVMEHCDRGCLKGFLAQHKNRFTSFVEDGEWIYNEELEMALQSQIFIEDEPPVTFNTLQLFKWCIEIADAMNFLAEKNIVHVSLSAKNVLLDSNFSSKISDFHMVKLVGVVVPSNALLNTSRKNQQKERIVPWRWYAIESLEDDVFNSFTDVWTFAIFMYEVFTLGATPYPDFTYGPEFILAIKHGYRLQAPDFATTECYQLMLMCWNDAPEKRPCFVKLKSKLEEMSTTKNAPVCVSVARSFQFMKSLSNF